MDRYPTLYRWLIRTVGAFWRWMARLLRADRWFPDRGIGDRTGYHLANDDPPNVADPPDGPGPPIDLPSDPATFMHANLGRFPHCDTRILHAPGECDFCDRHPDWQALRIAWGIAFTGQAPDGDRFRLPCPADEARPPGSPSDHRAWYGNVPAAR